MDKTPKPSEIGPIETILGIIIIIVIGSYIQNELYGSADASVSAAAFFGGWMGDWTAVITYVKFVAVMLVVLGGVGVFFLVKRLVRLRRAEVEKLELKPREEKGGEAAPARNRQWERVLEHVSADKENDWKLAILEADTILNEMLTAMGYRGDSIGEQLKQVEKSDFRTLDNAWEAHKVRNRIAHDGHKFAISQHEARRIIELYRSVFEEFHYI